MKIYNSDLIELIIANKDIKTELFDSKTNKKMSFLDYVNNSIYLADYLINNCKLQKWEVVIAFSINPIYYSIFVLATFMAWAKFVILEPSMWEENLKSKIVELQPKIWFYDTVFVDNVFSKFILSKAKISNPYKIPWLNIISVWNNYFSKKEVLNVNFKEKREITNLEFIEFLNEDDSIVVFTWWTTSDPKWVVHSHNSIFYMLDEIKNLTKNTEVFYADMPQFILLWIISWKKVIVWRMKYSLKKLINTIKKFNVDTIFSPPYKFNDLMRKKIKIPKCLKYIFFGSAPVYTWFLEKIYKYTNDFIKIYSIYWMTEMLPIALIDWKEKIQLQENIKWDILWYPLEWIEYKLEKDNELFLKGKHASKKYFWKERYDFIQTWDVVEIVSNKWRDLLTILSRKKDMIIRKEYNIYPSLYEKTINNIPFIKNSALIWVWNEIKEDEDIVLCIELEDKYKSENFCKLKKELFQLLKFWNYSIDDFAIPDFIEKINIPCSWKQNKVNKIILKHNYLKLLWK